MSELAPRPSLKDFPQHGLLSLWDMIKLDASAITALSHVFAGANQRVAEWKAGGHWNKVRSEELSPDDVSATLEVADTVSGYLDLLKCTYTALSYKRLIESLRGERKLTIEQYCSAVSDVSQRFHDELGMVPIFFTTKNIADYWGRDDLVTAPVREKFPGPSQELRWAGSAYCCSLATASVFHSMRAAESGLKAVATELGCSIADSENMKVIIDQIRKAASKISDEYGTPDKKLRSQHYSEVAIEAGLFKDAWRNYVSHAKVVYDQDQAFNILNATRRFFEKVVSPLQDVS